MQPALEYSPKALRRAKTASKRLTEVHKFRKKYGSTLGEDTGKILEMIKGIESSLNYIETTERKGLNYPERSKYRSELVAALGFLRYAL